MDKINQYMQYAIKQATTAKNMGEVPVGCVIVCNDEVIASGHNTVEKDKNATMHAEMVAIYNAMKKLSKKRLDKCDLYVTMEPCLMCAGAISHSRIKKVVFGCYDPNNGCIEHNQKIFSNIKTNHSPEIIGGVEMDECKKLVQDFFESKR